MNCSVCGDLIEGRYITLNDKNVCIRCSRLPVCSYCHLPIRNGKPVEIDLNHISCPKCFPNLVMKEEQLKALFKVSLILLAEMYTIKLKKLKKISFLDFSETIRATRHTLSGQGCSPLNVAGMANSDNEIIIQKGRPKGEVLGTITHELAHIWQFQEWGEVKLGEIEKYQLEGFCEWISYQLLIRAKFKEDAEKLKSSEDEIYGKGLRYYLDLEKEYKTEAIIMGDINFAKESKKKET